MILMDSNISNSASGVNNSRPSSTEASASGSTSTSIGINMMPFGYSQLHPVPHVNNHITDNNNSSRGLSALQKRAQQLKKWQEYEDFLAKMQQQEDQTTGDNDLNPAGDDENHDDSNFNSDMTDHRNKSFSRQQNKRYNSSNSSNGSQNNNNQRSAKHQKRSGPKIRFSDKTLFLAACSNNDTEECKRLLSSGIDINVVNVDGMTGLHQACIDDNLSMVQFLVSNGADINACDNDGWTPLHATASCGHYSIAEYLLENGADATIANNDGELPSDISDTEEVEELIHKYLKQLNITNLDDLRCREVHVMNQDINHWISTGIFDDKPHPRTGASILHVAASKGYLNILNTLVNHAKLRPQMNIDVLDHEKWTPLAAACYWQQPGSVEILLEAGADVYYKTPSGQTLEDLTENEVIVKMIESHRKKLIEDQRIREEKLIAALKLRRESLQLLTNGSNVIPPSVPTVVPPTVPSSAPPPLVPSSTNMNSSSQPTLPSSPASSSVTTTSDNNIMITQQNNHHNHENKASTPVEQNSKEPSTPSLVVPSGPSVVPSSPSSGVSSPASLIETQTEIQRKAHAKRVRETRRSTQGISADDVSKAKDQLQKQMLQNQQQQQMNSNNNTRPTPTDTSINSNSSNEMQSSTAGSTVVTEKQKKGVKDISVTDSSSSLNPPNHHLQTSSVTSSSSSSNNIIPDHRLQQNNASSSNSNIVVTSTAPVVAPQNNSSIHNNETKDYKKLYEDSVATIETLKKEISNMRSEFNREKRQQQRKISEYEEELKLLDVLKTHNQRLKDENGALIRVISKLSK